MISFQNLLFVLGSTIISKLHLMRLVTKVRFVCDQKVRRLFGWSLLKRAMLATVRLMARLMSRFAEQTWMSGPSLRGRSFSTASRCFLRTTGRLPTRVNQAFGLDGCRSLFVGLSTTCSIKGPERHRAFHRPPPRHRHVFQQFHRAMSQRQRACRRSSVRQLQR